MEFQILGINLLCQLKFLNRVVSPSVVTVDDAKITMYKWFRLIAGNKLLQLGKSFCEFALPNPRIGKVDPGLHVLGIVLQFQLELLGSF